MKRLLILLLFLLTPIVYGAIDDWIYYGNDPDLNMNYQSGNQEFVLEPIASVTYNTALQPLIADINLDGYKNFVAFDTNKIRLYYAENLSFIAETSTGYNKPRDYAIANLNDSDLYPEIIMVASTTSNSSEYHFIRYRYDGSFHKEVDFKLNDHWDIIGYMRCSNDYDNDLDNDCLMVLRDKASNYDLVGFDMNTNSANNPSINISLGTYSVSSVPEIIDANRDGYNDALIYDNDKLVVVNQTGVVTHLDGFSTLYKHLVARWYNRDGGDYEILVMYKVTGSVAGPGYNGGIALALYDYDGNNIWTTSLNDRCPKTWHSTEADGCCNTKFTLSLGFSDINDGRIYAFGSCTCGSEDLTSNVCAYDKDGNLFSKNSVSPSFYAYTQNKVTYADMKGGVNLEFVTAKGIIGLDGVVIQSPMGTADNDGWCLPIDLDGDLLLELICSQEGVNTTIFDETGFGTENLRPDMNYFTLDNYYPEINQPVRVKVYASDNENDDIYYAVDCNYDSGAEYGYTMADYPSTVYGWKVEDYDFKTCEYSVAGNYTIKAWVTDLSHGGENDLLSNMDSYEYTVMVGNISIPCDEPYIFCENFNYQIPIKNNYWQVENPNDVFDLSLAPDGSKLTLQNETWNIHHFFTQQKNPIITIKFNLSIDTKGLNSTYVDFVLLSSEDYLDQVWLSFNDNKIYTYSGQEAKQIGTYTDNTEYKYQIIVYYEDVAGVGNLSRKRANTYDVIQNGNRIAENLIFYHGSKGQFSVNRTDDQEFYSDLIGFIFEGDTATNNYLFLSLDDVYIYKGTSETYDNTADLMSIPYIPKDDYTDINEYFGCWVVKGKDAGKFDCGYSRLKCEKCCNYVKGVLKPTSLWCAVKKVLRMYAEQIRNWFFKNIWYFVFFGGLLIVLGFLAKYLF